MPILSLQRHVVNWVGPRRARLVAESGPIADMRKRLHPVRSLAWCNLSIKALDEPSESIGGGVAVGHGDEHEPGSARSPTTLGRAAMLGNAGR